jgi:hypothetical protein
MKSTYTYPTTLASGRTLSCLVLTLLLGATQVTQVNAAQTVRELWDDLSAGTSLDGKGSGSTTLGLDANTSWAVSPAGNTGVQYDNSWTLSWELGGMGNADVLLPSSNGGNGMAVFYGGNMATLIDPATSLPYGIYSSASYATRALTPNACIDFKSNGTCYFSASVVKSYPWWNGDNAMGIGFASSGATNAHFVGAGITRTSYLSGNGVTDIGDAAYITTGTLDQPGVASHPGDSGGPYYVRASGPGQIFGADPVNNTFAGLIVGRLTTTSSGTATLDVKAYVSSSTLDTNENDIVWDATYSFTETNVMTQLLLWAYGSGPARLDAIRVGTSYGDVIGLELIGAPKGNPGNTVYAGTTVTLSQSGGLNTASFPMSFQWRSNSIALTDATNSTLVLTSPTTNYTADYSVVVSNYYGTLTSAVTHVTVNPAGAPFITVQPAAMSRYLGASTATLSVVVDGTPPFTYQWKHANTNIQSATTTSSGTNTLTLGPVALADAGAYSVTITNQFGSTNSDPATLTVLNPTPGTYAALIISNSPYGYWRLDDQGDATNPTVIHDDWGANDGVALDSADPDQTMLFGVPAAPLTGFPTPHEGITVGWNTWINGHPSRLNLPQLPAGYSNTMTFAMWVNGGCQLMARNGYGGAYGVDVSTNGHWGVTTLWFDWGGLQWDSGFTVPPNTWTFVALVVEPSQATVYMGTNKVSLDSAVSYQFFPPLFSSTENGDAPTALTPLAVGRNPWPWAEEGAGQGWATLGGTWSDVAVFYQSLTAQQIQDLYFAGIGPWIEGTPDGLGNLMLNWSGTLQQSSNVEGPYTDVGVSPPYSVPMTAPGKFYRTRL